MRARRAILGKETAERSVALAARRDDAGDDALAFNVAVDRRAELFDDADRLVADRQAVGDWVFALENVNVRPADRSRRTAEERVSLADGRDRLVRKDDPAGLDEVGCSHACDCDAQFSERKSLRY
jgi:hypothetical protein